LGWGSTAAQCVTWGVLGCLTLSSCGRTHSVDATATTGTAGDGGGESQSAGAGGALESAEGGSSGEGSTLFEAGSACETNEECASSSCVDGRCCREVCISCQACTGPGGTCVALELRTEDDGPPGACAGDRWCTEKGCELRAQVVVGETHTCALSADGKVTCWGNGFLSGYGADDNIGDDEPAGAKGFVGVGADAVELAAGDTHTCALLSDGNVRCWGNGTLGQLGYGDVADIGAAADAGNIDLGGKANHITASFMHTCALLSDATVRCWGYDGHSGVLGYPGKNFTEAGETPAALGPVDVGAPVISLITGPYVTCALLENHQPRCWGENTHGELGYPDFDNIGDNEPPASAGVTELSDVQQMAPGYHTNCALMSNGEVRCWGGGYGEPLNSQIGAINVGTNTVAIAAGRWNVCTLGMEGQLRCWGENATGQLGYGHTNPVSGLDNQAPAHVGDVPVGEQVEEVAVGTNHVCVLMTGDRIRCWGNGSDGQLGYGNTNNVGDDETPASVGDVPYR
jgi:alpha-tubulin suppressor-like RCC1 family protein